MKRTAAIALLLVAAVLGTGCTGGAVETVLYYVIVSNDWTDANDANHDFLLQSSDDGKTSGALSGTERSNGSDVGTVSGGWSENVVTMVVDRSGAITTYHADFMANNPTTLVFRAGSETLTLNRQ